MIKSALFILLVMSKTAMLLGLLWLYIFIDNNYDFAVGIGVPPIQKHLLLLFSLGIVSHLFLVLIFFRTNKKLRSYYLVSKAFETFTWIIFWPILFAPLRVVFPGLDEPYILWLSLLGLFSGHLLFTLIGFHFISSRL